jgi:hypothetical protein
MGRIMSPVTIPRQLEIKLFDGFVYIEVETVDFFVCQFA